MHMFVFTVWLWLQLMPNIRHSVSSRSGGPSLAVASVHCVKTLRCGPFRNNLTLTLPLTLTLTLKVRSVQEQAFHVDIHARGS